MALTRTQVSQLYVAIFNRASEGSGNAFWQAYADAGTAATEMLATTDARAYFGDSLDSNQAFVEHIYLNTLNKTVEDDPDGIAFWVDLLDNGAARGDTVASLVSVIASYGPDGDNHDPEDAATVAAYNQFVNRVEISDYMAQQVENAPADYARSTAFDKDLAVTDDPDTVTSAKAAVDALAETGGDDPGDPGFDAAITLNDLATVDVSDGAYNIILDFNAAPGVKLGNINGFGEDDRITFENTPAGAAAAVDSSTATSLDFGYGVFFDNAWVFGMGDLEASLVAQVMAASGVDDQLDVLGTQWGDNWFNVA